MLWTAKVAHYLSSISAAIGIVPFFFVLVLVLFFAEWYVFVAADVCPRVLQTAQLFFPKMNAIKMVSAKMMIYGFKLLHVKNELSAIGIINVCCCFQLLHIELIVSH